jgi:hypothetical protein
MRVHLVAYTAHTLTGPEHGVAQVRSDRNRPSWRECADAIPGYFTGKYLGLAPTYKLRYVTESGRRERELTASGIERVGAVVMRMADRDAAWDIEVLDANGGDVTFDFTCFA